MQQTFELNTENLNLSFLEAVRKLFGKKEVRIVIEDIQPIDEQEKLLKKTFGSWQGEETGDELVKQIYASRRNSYDMDDKKHIFVK